MYPTNVLIVNRFTYDFPNIKCYEHKLAFSSHGDDLKWLYRVWASRINYNKKDTWCNI